MTFYKFYFTSSYKYSRFPVIIKQPEIKLSTIIITIIIIIIDNFNDFVSVFSFFPPNQL